MMKKVIVGLMLVVSLQAAEQPPKHTKAEWVGFAVTMVLEGFGTWLDMKSSLDCNGVVGQGGARCIESNPLYRSGTDQGFHERGVGIMWGISGGLMGGETWLFLKRNKWVYLLEGANGGFGTVHLVEWKKNRNLQKEILDWRPPTQ